MAAGSSNDFDMKGTGNSAREACTVLHPLADSSALAPSAKRANNSSSTRGRDTTFNSGDIVKRRRSNNAPSGSAVASALYHGLGNLTGDAVPVVFTTAALPALSRKFDGDELPRKTKKQRAVPVVFTTAALPALSRKFDGDELPRKTKNQRVESDELGFWYRFHKDFQGSTGVNAWNGDLSDLCGYSDASTTIQADGSNSDEEQPPLSWGTQHYNDTVSFDAKPLFVAKNGVISQISACGCLLRRATAGCRSFSRCKEWIDLGSCLEMGLCEGCSMANLEPDLGVNANDATACRNCREKNCTRHFTGPDSGTIMDLLQKALRKREAQKDDGPLLGISQQKRCSWRPYPAQYTSCASER